MKLPKPKPLPPAQLLARRVLVLLRRAVRCGPAVAVEELPKDLGPGLYVVVTKNGRRHVLDAGGVHSEFVLLSGFDHPVVPVLFATAKVGEPAHFDLSARDWLGTAPVVEILARPEFCPVCGGALLGGWCWRRAFMRGQWWLWETHYLGKSYSRKYRAFRRVSAFMFRLGL